MDEATIRQVFLLLGAPASKVKRSGEWIMGPCPFAPVTHSSGRDSNPSFGIHIHDGASGYNCLACHESGLVANLPPRLVSVLRKPQGALQKFVADQHFSVAFGDFEDSAVPQPPDPIDADEVKSIFDSVVDLMRKAKQRPGKMPPILEVFMRRRGVYSVATAAMFELLWDGYRSRLIMPCIDLHGEWYGLAGRRAVDRDDGIPKMLFYDGFKKEQFLFGEHLVELSDPKKPIALVEGHMTVLAAFTCGATNMVDVVASQGSSLSAAQVSRLAQLDKPVVVCYDDDEAGDRGAWGGDRKPGAVQKLRDILPTRVAGRIEGKPDPDTWSANEWYEAVINKNRSPWPKTQSA
jgi:hypothetical protein